jgi:hypothetical protein
MVGLGHRRQRIEREKKFVCLFVVEIHDQNRNFHRRRCGLSQMAIYQPDLAVWQDAADQRVGIADFRQETFKCGGLLRRVDSPIFLVGHKLRGFHAPELLDAVADFHSLAPTFGACRVRFCEALVIA